jgi:signal peptidase I
MEDHNFAKEAIEEVEGNSEKATKDSKKEAIEWVQAIVTAVVLALLIRIYLFEIILVVGESMVPTLDDGDRVFVSKIVFSRLMYDGIDVLAIGDWAQEGTGFKADYIVAFDKATIKLDTDGVTVYPRGGKAFKPELSSQSFYEAEIEFFVDTVSSGTVNEVNPPSSAATTVKLIDTLRESARSGGDIIPFEPR